MWDIHCVWLNYCICLVSIWWRQYWTKNNRLWLAPKPRSQAKDCGRSNVLIQPTTILCFRRERGLPCRKGVIFHYNLFDFLTLYQQQHSSYSYKVYVMARMVNSILQGDPNLPNTDCFRWTRQSIFTPWVEALGWPRSLNHGWEVLQERRYVAQTQAWVPYT